jgi:hypothetical protein
MKIIKTVKMTFFCIFMHFFTANAQNTLKSNDIDNYLTSLKSISSMMERYNKENKPKEDTELETLPTIGDLSKTPITDSLAYVKSHPTYSSLEMIVQSSGFQSVEEWANVGDNIISAYTAFYLKYSAGSDAKSIEETINDLTAQRDQISKNLFISSEQKNILTEKIENSIAMLNDPNYINNENIKILSPYMKRLNSLFKEQ